MKKNQTSKKVLLTICIFLIVFTGVCLWLFYERSAVPDSLIVAVFSAALGELGVLSWIRTTKQKYPDTKHEDEDVEISDDFTEEV